MGLEGVGGRNRVSRIYNFHGSYHCGLLGYDVEQYTEWEPHSYLSPEDVNSEICTHLPDYNTVS